jgi:hypothetical protein
VLLHAVLDPDRGERCDCGALAVVVFVLPLAGRPQRIAWCGEKCGATDGTSPSTYQLLTARRRLRQWWRTHNLLGQPVAADDELRQPRRDEGRRTR